MTILIDADGCPVVDLTLQTAAKYNVPVLILCDTAHQIQRDGAQTLTFGKGADSVDFALVNRVCAGDLVITQDYGLASMCLARRARVLNQNGLEYTPENIFCGSIFLCPFLGTGPAGAKGGNPLHNEGGLWAQRKASSFNFGAAPV